MGLFSITGLPSVFCCGATIERSVADDHRAEKSLDRTKLSYVGQAAHDVLEKEHTHLQGRLWNVTSGEIVGELHQTPKLGWKSMTDPPEGNDVWFPKKIGEIVARTERWCDIVQLGPPDGIFLEEIKKAFAVIWERSLTSEEPIIIRMLFGHIPSLPVDCIKVVECLTEGLPKDAKVFLWVSAWRKGPSWNHAKIIAVDGKYLETGGHNLWEYHYLQGNPVHDLSVEMTGDVAIDGHFFANDQWQYIKRKRKALFYGVTEVWPRSIVLPWTVRVSLAWWPPRKRVSFPPQYTRHLVPRREEPERGHPIISLGRYGMLQLTHRPSDDAFLAMLGASKTVIRMALQDLGPFCIPYTKITLPGCVWPEDYFSVLGKAMYDRNVVVEIALSNPRSIPGELSPLDAIYGNGWTCVDVAAEMINRIKAIYPDATDEELRKLLKENLRLCYIREACGKTWKNGKTMGMHAKHFIIDDVLMYIGSQNLYVCDLAEWGVAIDDEAETKRIMDEYWNPLWKASYTGEDCDAEEVMQSLEVDRTGENPEAKKAAKETELAMENIAKQQALKSGAGQGQFYGVSRRARKKKTPDLATSMLRH